MNKRIYLFDNLKALLIVLVVAGHLADTYIKAPFFKGIYVFIYAFHMPLFIFISGYFHRNEKVFRKILVYFSIGYSLKIIDYVLFYVLDGTKPSKPFSEEGAPWFMFALCAYIGITYILREHDIRLIITGAVILGCFSGYYEWIGDFLVLSRVIVFYPYYLLGVCAARLNFMKISKFLSKYKRSILLNYLAIAIMVTWTYWCFGETDFIYKYRRLFTGRNSFGEYFSYFGCIHRLFCYGLAVVIGITVIFLVENKKIPFVTYIGTKTLQIYFWHWPFVYIIKRLCPVSEICHNLYGQMLFLLLTIPMVLFFALPIFEYPMKFILKYRHEEKNNTISDV